MVKATRNGIPYAIKTFLDREEGEEPSCLRFELEASILQTLKHPQIPSFIETFSHANIRYLVQEFIGGFPLSYFIGSGRLFSEGEIVGLLRQLLVILEDLHQPSVGTPAVIHRDLRLSNLLLDDNSLYLIDFGFARYLDPAGFTFCPDPPVNKLTCRPQGKGRKPCSSTYSLLRKEISPQSDLFGAGVVVIDLMTNWVRDEAQFARPWQDVLPVSKPFKEYIEGLFSRSFDSATQALTSLDSLPES